MTVMFERLKLNFNFSLLTYTLQKDLISRLKEVLGPSALLIDWRKNKGRPEDSKSYVDVDGLRVS